MKNIAVMPNLTKDMPSKERITELVRWGLYTLCFIGILMHLVQYDNVYYQNEKNVQAGFVLILFSVFLFVLQRVKLLNIPSLIVSIGYGILAFFGTRMYLFAPDVLPSQILYRIAEWIALMVVVDMAVTKRVRRLKESNLWLFGILFVMLVLMEILYPNIETRVYLWFFILCLIPVTSKEWNIVFPALLTAGFLFSIVAAILSHVINPYIGDEVVIRSLWGGFMANPARAGEFCDLLSGLAFIAVFYSRKRFGRFGFCYLTSVIWLLVTIVYGFLIGKSNYFVGLIVLLLFFFVFGLSNTKSPWLLLRGCLVLSVLFLTGYIVLDLIAVVANTGFDSQKLYDVVNKTPLHLFPGFANRIVRKITSFSQKGVSTELLGNPVLALINSIASSRVVIARGIWKVTSFTHSTGKFLRYSTSHTGYIEPMYHYGYLAGGMNLLFFASGLVTAIARYVKEKRFEYLASFCLLALAFGVWTGEAETALFPVTFMALFAVAPCMIGKDKKRERTKA